MSFLRVRACARACVGRGWRLTLDRFRLREAFLGGVFGMRVFGKWFSETFWDAFFGRCLWGGVLLGRVLFGNLLTYFSPGWVLLASRTAEALIKLLGHLSSGVSWLAGGEF